MSQAMSREVVLLASQTLTTSGAGNDINVPMGWQAATISVNGQTITGTSPTFNFFIQKKLGQASATDLVGNPPTGTAIYDDVLAFTTFSTATTRISQLCIGPQTPTANATTTTTCDWIQSDAALGFGQQRIGQMGPLWRVKWAVGGTSPSGVFIVTAQLVGAIT